MEEFGDSTFVIKTVPLIFGRLQHSQTIQEVVSTLLEKQNSIEMLKEEIKRGDKINLSVDEGNNVKVIKI